MTSGKFSTEEVSRLPERYRAAVVLCLLEGLTPEQAAQQLGWPAGTVHSRLARGRERLRGRLTRQGLAPAIAGAGLLLAAEPAGAVPPCAGCRNGTGRHACHGRGNRRRNRLRLGRRTHKRSTEDQNDYQAIDRRQGRRWRWASP